MEKTRLLVMIKIESIKKELLPTLFFVKKYNYFYIIILKKNSLKAKIDFLKYFHFLIKFLKPNYYLTATNTVAQSETINNNGIK